jgi:2-methylcitrate dehydratase PrpD
LPAISTGEEIMDRTTASGLSDPPRRERRRFLKQIATTGAAAGTMVLPGWAQEKPVSPVTPGRPADQPPVAETLARYATSLEYEDLPAEVVRETKRYMIDSIGCGLGGFGSDASRIANRLAAGASAEHGATVMCSGVKTSPDLAAFANGVMIRYLDFNDGYISLGAGHPSDTIAPLRSFFADVDEIEEVIIRVSRKAIQVMADSPDKWRPQTHETADHSMPYAAAVALMYGTVEEQHYEDPYLHDRRLLNLVGRVRCLPFDAADRVEQEMNPCDLEIVLKSGQRKNVRVEYHRGHWKNPMTDAEVEEKFRALARRQLPAAQTDSLLHQLWALDSLPKAGELIATTRV